MKIARNERGFTLIELMVVVIIIGILAAIAIPIMSKQTDKAKVKRAVSELKSMKTAVDVWSIDPAQNDGLTAPLADATDGTTNGIEEILTEAGIDIKNVDPWGTPYYYLADKAGEGMSEPIYYLYSFGPDKEKTGNDNITVSNTTNPLESQGEPKLYTVDENGEPTNTEVSVDNIGNIAIGKD